MTKRITISTILIREGLHYLGIKELFALLRGITSKRDFLV